MDKSLERRMAQVLERCEDLVLASVDGDGFPRPVPMCKIHSAGINEIWVSTGADSVKFAQFMNNPKAGLCYFEKGRSMVMTGLVKIVTDDKKRKELWEEWMYRHYPQGPTDPNFVLLRFIGESVTVWYEGEFVHEII
ncbi:general stress protein [Phocaeicola sartorii]|jgi:Uncharacterized stress protein (general stress protein 26)|uniref:General stress protein n=1 Tax=Phocaeicola sartorii TaxID=671267 RepID=A0A4S2FJZ5_9BACT|nr:pyridoxamine 5'-phosphate oxidase family protein [Phocaeicola sartorii]TGY69263.1 general stress protein [Phocaeicola sartorii]